jgi:predicted component of type VI protein secretion system
MPARLVAVDDRHQILVDKPILLVGRHPECDIQLESTKVSRQHCCLAYAAAHLVVRDLDSTNGIRINGQRVAEGRLSHGDQLTIGNFNFKVIWEDQPGLEPGAHSGPPPAPIPMVALAGAEHTMGSRPVPLENLMSCEMPVPLVDHGQLPVTDKDPPLPKAPRTRAEAEKGASPNRPEPP